MNISTHNPVEYVILTTDQITDDGVFIRSGSIGKLVATIGTQVLLGDEIIQYNLFVIDFLEARYPVKEFFVKVFDNGVH